MNITATTFPKQGPYAGVRARVSFDYDSSQIIEGTFVREDAEAAVKDGTSKAPQYSPAQE